MKRKSWPTNKKNANDDDDDGGERKQESESEREGMKEKALEEHKYKYAFDTALLLHHLVLSLWEFIYLFIYLI